MRLLRCGAAIPADCRAKHIRRELTGLESTSHRKVAVLLLNRSQVKPSLQDRRGSKCGSLWACLPKPLVARQLTWAAIWRMSTVVEAMRRRLEGCGATRASRHTAVVLARHHKELDALLGMLEWGDPQCQRKRGQDRPILPPHA